MLKGKNLTLRTLEKNDLERARAWVNDQQIARLMLRSRHVSVMDQRQWFEDLKKDKSKIIFAIKTVKEKKHIGNMGLYEIDESHKKAKLWILLGDKAFWGKGLGKEAVSLLLEYAFLHLNLKKVWLEVDKENIRAVHCYEKAGFIKEGLLRSDVFIAEKRRDVLRMAVLASEF